MAILGYLGQPVTIHETACEPGKTVSRNRCQEYDSEKLYMDKPVIGFLLCSTLFGGVAVGLVSHSLIWGFGTFGILWLIIGILIIIAMDQFINQGKPELAIKTGILTRSKMESELHSVRGRRIAVYHQSGMPWAEAAAGRLNRTLLDAGALIHSEAQEYEIHINNGTRLECRFVINRVASPNRTTVMDRDCTPDILEECVIVGVCYSIKKAG
jgi:hypothetical protein